MKIIILLSILILSNFLMCKNSEYYETEKKIKKQISEKEFLKAESTIKKALNIYPEQYFELSLKLTESYLEQGKNLNCLNLWSEGNEKGYFYGVGLGFYDAEKFTEYDSLFQKIKEKDTELWKSATENGHCQYEVDLPHNYDQETSYPIIFVFHGGYSTIEQARKSWSTDVLNNNFITVYVQSYLHYNSKRFGWKGFDPKAREEITQIFKELKSQFKTKNTILAGVSAGGLTAIDLSINNIIPVDGFIGVCPVKPKEFSLENINTAAKNGVKGFFIEGDQDFAIEKQKAMKEIIAQSNMKFDNIINKGMGHEFPENFEKQLKKAVDFILIDEE